MTIVCGKCGEQFNNVEGARVHKCKVKNPPSILQTERPLHKVTTVDLSTLLGKESRISRWLNKLKFWGK